MKKILIIAVGLILALGLSFAPAPVKATPILDFGIIAPTTGSISYAGGAAPLVGVNIEVDNVTLIPGGPVPPYPIISGNLGFTTGNLTGTTANSWKFGGGQNTSIILTGTVDVDRDGIADVGEPTGILFQGNFGNAEVITFGSTYKIAGSSFSDRKNEALLNLFGLPNMLYSGNFNISFNATGLPPNAFDSTTVLSGDVTNSPIPEPATMLLLGSGLIGLAGFARRKFRKN